MRIKRALDPAAHFDEAGEIEAWDACVDAAYIFWEQGINAFPKPTEDFDYTFTHKYSDEFARTHSDGIRIGNTWFYNKE